MDQAQAVGKNGLIPSCVELSNGLEFQLLIDLYLSLAFETPTCYWKCLIKIINLETNQVFIMKFTKKSLTNNDYLPGNLKYLSITAFNLILYKLCDLNFLYFILIHIKTSKRTPIYKLLSKYFRNG